jgi:Rieske Fe-S protein
MERREMLLRSVYTLGGICLCAKTFSDDPERSNCCYTPLIESESVHYQGSNIFIDLEKAISIQDPGYAAYLVDEVRNIQLIIFQVEEGEYYALSRFCTHGGQVVSYIRERQLVQCNNFNHSIFRLNGSVYKGPAPVPLPSFPVKVDGRNLIIELSNENL